MSEPIILVPLDGTKQALAALPVAIVLGEIEQASLHILHVGECEQAGKESRSLSHARLSCSAALQLTPALGCRRGKFYRRRER